MVFTRFPLKIDLSWSFVNVPSVTAKQAEMVN